MQISSYICWPVHGAELHGDQCTAGCEEDTNFADESIRLLGDNFRNEVITVHRSQKVFEIAVHLNADIPRTDRKGSNLPFETVLQEYLQFPYEYLLYTNIVKQPT
jgi:hypothetical protein